MGAHGNLATMGVRAGCIAAIVTIALAAPARADGHDPVTGAADPVHGNEAPGLVAFTFDDGPIVGTTDRVIDALLAYDVPATFFVVGHRIQGKHAAGARALVTRMLEHGFLVGDHSFSHVHLGDLEPKQMTWQIDHTKHLLDALIGAPIGLFRAPYGELGKAVSAHLARLGLTPVQWSIDSHDWQGPRPGVMRAAILDKIFRENGGVVLMHDTKKLTANNVAALLDELEVRNCARLDRGDPPIIPVSLHYFLRDRGKARAIPSEVEARTQRYRAALPLRCKTRRHDAEHANVGS